MEVGEKKKARSRIHLIKADHSVTKGGKPLAALPQFLPISFTKTFIQPLDEKTKKKTKGELSTTVHDIRKPTYWIST